MLHYQTSKNIKEEFLEEVNRLDHLYYPEEFTGSVNSIKDRFINNKEEYILCWDDNKLVGYICFFPISKKLEEKILKGNFVDDDITKDDILTYEQIKNPTSVLVLSIVVDAKYRNRGIATQLMYMMIEFLKVMQLSGVGIKYLYGEAINEAGVKLAKFFNFEEIKNINSKFKLLRLELNQ